MAEEKPFVLRVSLTFQTTQDRDELLAAFKPLAQHVRQHEPDTLAYEVLHLDSNPLNVVIFERYASKAALEEVHRQSEPFKAFVAAYLADDAEWRRNHPLDVSIETYTESGIGHLQR